ncbi:YdcF family protein [Ferrimonas sediminicola]|uniref:YdcF family protein n=1 Tax=Ferrimonas sediminicola TaxID=2569538 RepID=A0A4U1BFI7_9GAMM|nr:ElyC/SanA/YdcF family protein [Ferrimonas sediminicola]TKB49998.1 YdcF family protein [Ferrimonas sediminicola]
MLGFWIKKAVSALLLPIPLATLLILAGLWCRRRHPRLGRPLIVAGPALLLFLSSSFGSQWLARPLERKYPLWRDVPVQVVMVLGSGHDSSVSPLPQQRLSDTALARLTEGVRLARRYPQASLVFSGWRDFDPNAHAQVMAEAAVALGVAPERIVTIPDALDTAMEARLLRRRVGAAEVALVTSATHMPRAMRLFRQQGIRAKPAPTDFIGREGAWWRFSASNLLTSERALHEYLGLCWHQLASLWRPASADAT